MVRTIAALALATLLAACAMPDSASMAPTEGTNPNASGLTTLAPGF
ncbi:hypothetical protein [Pontivivens ytuae]|uniref:Lipoprotein n=1 Tax=Pontivivens ytuae TaxID=2789856 RepID=A0A7S9QD27_9RHOB|nr:hypothetical protein [Pontivivens ytuae]QPH53932.1 hypothetical protein I0K15_19515 [Pontivivens ytuae]